MFWTVTQSLISGLGTATQLFALTLLFGLPLGLVIAFGSMSKWRPLKAIVDVIVWIIRGTPLMLQLIIIYYGPGLWLDQNIWGGGSSGRMTACVIAFVINYSCYFSVIYRGGIQGVPVGQREAAEVLGFTKSQIFFKVTLLQMIKRIVPPMSNEIITLVKDTSLAFAIGVAEMFSTAKALVASQRSMMPFAISALFYWGFNFLVEIILGRIEKKMDYYHD